MKMMKVLDGYGTKAIHRKFPDAPKEIPMRLLSEEWARNNHGQTLDRLNERGGLSIGEMLDNIKRQKLTIAWEETTQEQIDELKKILHADLISHQQVKSQPITQIEKKFNEADKLIMDLRVKNLPFEKDLYDIQALLFQIQDIIASQPTAQPSNNGEIKTVNPIGYLKNGKYLSFKQMQSETNDTADEVKPLYEIAIWQSDKEEIIKWLNNRPEYAGELYDRAVSEFLTFINSLPSSPPIQRDRRKEVEVEEIDCPWCDGKGWIVEKNGADEDINTPCMPCDLNGRISTERMKAFFAESEKRIEDSKEDGDDDLPF